MSLSNRRHRSDEALSDNKIPNPSGASPRGTAVPCGGRVIHMSARESGQVPDKDLSEPERAELERLRKENASLRMERDFAKKVIMPAGVGTLAA